MSFACYFTVAMTPIIYTHISTYMHLTQNLSWKLAANHETLVLTLSVSCHRKSKSPLLPTHMWKTVG